MFTIIAHSGDGTRAGRTIESAAQGSAADTNRYTLTAAAHARRATAHTAANAGQRCGSGRLQANTR